MENNECSICLTLLDKNDKSIVTVKCCNQQFHIHCYLNCMSLKKECPLCRNKYNETILEKSSPSLLPDTIVNINVVEYENQLILQRKRQRYIGCLLVTIFSIIFILPSIPNLNLFLK